MKAQTLKDSPLTAPESYGPLGPPSCLDLTGASFQNVGEGSTSSRLLPDTRNVFLSAFWFPPIRDYSFPVNIAEADLKRARACFVGVGKAQVYTKSSYVPYRRNERVFKHSKKTEEKERIDEMKKEQVKFEIEIGSRPFDLFEVHYANQTWSMLFCHMLFFFLSPILLPLHMLASKITCRKIVYPAPVGVWVRFFGMSVFLVGLLVLLLFSCGCAKFESTVTFYPDGSRIYRTTETGAIFLSRKGSFRVADEWLDSNNELHEFSTTRNVDENAQGQVEVFRYLFEAGKAAGSVGIAP